MANPQPAVKSYFFGKGYTDLENVIRGAFANNMATVKNFRVSRSIAWNSGNTIAGVFLSIFYFFATISMYVFGTLFCSVLTLIHVTILFVIMLTIYVIFSLIWIADSIYLAVNGIFGACPICKEKFKIPTYVCKCGRKHTKLTPGAYGILYRKCECGEKLPTTFFNGRPKIASKPGFKTECPVNGCQIKTGEAVPICIPVIGGPSVGKTCFITAAMKEFIEDVCPTCSLSLDFYDDKNELEYKNMVEKYKNGSLQAKTSDLNPAAFNFFIEKITPKRLIYLYDIAGEAFSTVDALNTQKHFEYSHGFIIMIDPLSIPEVREEYEEDINFNTFGVSESDIDDSFDAFIMNLKRISGLNANQLSSVPCAVVINKVDAFNLEEKIGFSAANALITSSDNKLENVHEGMDFLARKYLKDNGMHNYINKINNCFKNNRYFSCSSLGHSEDGLGFESLRVFEPVKWILSHCDKTLSKKISQYN